MALDASLSKHAEAIAILHQSSSLMFENNGRLQSSSSGAFAVQFCRP